MDEIQSRFETIFGSVPPKYVDNGISAQEDSVIKAEIMMDIKHAEVELENKAMGAHYSDESPVCWSDICYAFKERRHIFTVEEWTNIANVIESLISEDIVI